MTQKYLGDNLPGTGVEWRTAAARYNPVSIHELEAADSASEITVEQFLSLKALWPRRCKTADLYADKTAALFGSSKADIETVRATMRERDTCWTEYLKAVEAGAGRGSKFSRELGVYALVLQSQVEASKIKESLNDSERLRFTPMKKHNTRSQAQDENRDPKGKGQESRSESRGSHHPSQTSKSSSGPENISPKRRDEEPGLLIGDEQVVNTAAINFLNALFIHEARPADWTLERKQLRFNSRSVKFEARTDGHFEIHGHKQSAAILEVKPRTRYYERGFRIEMQESAQMALWIFQEPNSHWGPPGDDKHQ
jgi:hypothetical protein